MSYDQGFPPITSLPMGFGGIAPRREDFNAALKLLSEHAHYHQSGGQMTWSPELDYAERCEVYGSDGNKYVAQHASGPSIPSVGVKDPTAGDEAFWKRWDLNIKAPNASETTRGLVRLAAPEEAPGHARDIAVTPEGIHSWWRRYAPIQLDYPGWQRLPSGLILQWGGQHTDGTGIATIVYPVAFPSRKMLLVAVHCGGLSGTVVEDWTMALRLTDTRLLVFTGERRVPAGWGIHYIALGY